MVIIAIIVYLHFKNHKGGIRIKNHDFKKKHAKSMFFIKKPKKKSKKILKNNTEYGKILSIENNPIKMNGQFELFIDGEYAKTLFFIIASTQNAFTVTKQGVLRINSHIKNKKDKPQNDLKSSKEAADLSSNESKSTQSSKGWKSMSNTMTENINNNNEDCDIIIEKDTQQMGNCNGDLIQMANYLISLFYVTGQKYYCTRTKISKLMSIVAFYYARNNKILFTENIYKYDGCGTIIDEIKSSFDMDIYNGIQCKDNKQFIDETFDYKLYIPDKYRNYENVDNETKQNIENVFRKFGSFSAYNLGQCLNPIINYPNVINDNKVDLSTIKCLNKDCFTKIQDNREIIEFLFV